MKLEKAIRHFEELLYHDFIREDASYKGAIKLGIEALKRIQDRRYSSWGAKRPLLPGETKE